MEDGPLSLVRIVAADVEMLLALDRYDLDLKHHLARRLDDGRVGVPGIVSAEQVRTLEAAGYQIEVLTDLGQVAAERVAEVSTDNRFADGRGVIDFAERSVLGYMTAAEVESALINLQALHPDLITLYTMPYTTWEGRTSRAVRLRAGTGGDRPGVLIIGGVHAREWGGSDICVSFLVNLIDAYRAAGPLVYGGKTFSAAQVQAILTRLDVFVFPAVNPDGKNYSQTIDVASGQPSNLWWRKNRNPNAAAGGVNRGVDVNRNYDFLWTSGIGTSTSTASPTYRGTAAFSEPETKNVRHLFDTFPTIRYFVDVHSYGELMLYVWGDDDNQSVNIGQNFQNPAYNGLRGVPGDATYREFISTLDERTTVGLANRMHDALQAVRGKSYTVQQAVGLYPTSGTSDDYSFARHVVDPLKGKVYGYTIEFGQEFVPPFAEMTNIIKDVAAALTEFCWAANSDVFLRDSPADVGTTPSSGAFWNSPDIWVRNADDGGTTHQDTVRGQDNFVYVRVTNRGVAEARNLAIRLCLASFAGTEFIYPNDWIPKNPAGGGGISTPGTYLIGETTIAALAAGANQVVSLRWDAALIPPATNWHPCLLLEVAPNDGPASSGRQVWENNNLGQKNITIVNARRGARIAYPFRVGNPALIAPADELVVTKVKAPPSIGLYLDLADPVWLEAVVATIPSTPPVVPPMKPIDGDFWANLGLPKLAEGATAVLMQPSTVAVPTALFGRPGSGSFVLRFPARTSVEVRGRLVEEVLPRAVARAASGITLVKIANKPLLSLSAVTASSVPLPAQATTAKELTLNIEVPNDAVTGDVYELELAQRNEKGQVVGGVTLQVNVIE